MSSNCDPSGSSADLPERRLRANAEEERSLFLGITLPTFTEWEIDEGIASLAVDLKKASSFAAEIELIGKWLVAAIDRTLAPCFLLPTITRWIAKLNQQKLCRQSYAFSLFELWLRIDTTLTRKKRALLRAKIMGRHLPRESYQRLFPVGKEVYSPGSHIVTAHLSPDADALSVSFWGWVDAFAAEVGTAFHHWWLPSPTLTLPMMRTFQAVIGEEVFSLARLEGSVGVTANDLFSRDEIEYVPGDASLMGLEITSAGRAIVVLDPSTKQFIGMWLQGDAESVRQVILPFKSVLHAFERAMISLIALAFSQDHLLFDELRRMVYGLTEKPLFHYEDLLLSMPESQKGLLALLLKKTFSLEEGLETSIWKLSQQLSARGASSLYTLLEAFRSGVAVHSLFDGKGALSAGRQKLFIAMNDFLNRMDDAMWEARAWIERIDVSVTIRQALFEIYDPILLPQSDLEETTAKTKKRAVVPLFLDETMASAGGSSLLECGSPHPIGVVRASRLRSHPHATISLRDFSNAHEAKIAKEISIISVVDHHKSAVTTSQPAVIVTGDVQACAVLTAEISFLLNDEARREGGEWFIDTSREAAEYLSYLHAIFDDTDLLSKTTARDLHCVVELINRLHTLVEPGVEPPIVPKVLAIDSSPLDVTASHLLHLPFVYRLYRAIDQRRGEELMRQIREAAVGISDELFCDVKEHNGCCRVGQMKLFAKSRPAFQEAASALQKRWLATSLAIQQHRPEIDFHLQMVTTVPSSEELCGGKSIAPLSNDFCDELWIWVPEVRQGQDHLRSFLNSFTATPFFSEGAFRAELSIHADNSLVQLFSDFFSENIQKCVDSGVTAVLYCKAGAINSRKRMIAPYLPRGIVS